MPYRADGDMDSLKKLVREVNGTHLEPQEVLSDQVYRYDRKSGQTVIV